jgi:hypothetical protein
MSRSGDRRSPPRRKALETGFVRQTNPPAAEAEVDFHDRWVILAGIKTKTALFTLRLSYSGRGVHRSSLSQGQEAFLEAHVHAFERLGGCRRRSARTARHGCQETAPEMTTGPRAAHDGSRCSSVDGSLLRQEQRA